MKDADLKALTGVVQKMVLRRKDMSVEWLADHLGKRPSTLYNELNPNHTGTAKLGAQDLARIMDLFRDVTPLGHLASLMGCLVTPVPSLLQDKECPAPTPENFAAMLSNTHRHLKALAGTLRAAGNAETLDNEQCLEVLLDCQACHLALGEVLRTAQAGATRDALGNAAEN